MATQGSNPRRLPGPEALPAGDVGVGDRDLLREERRVGDRDRIEAVLVGRDGEREVLRGIGHGDGDGEFHGPGAYAKSRGLARSRALRYCPVVAQAAVTHRPTAGEYLAWEREQADKHEYHRGEVFAMAGGSPRHNFLSAAVVAELRAAFRGKGCYPLTSDQRLGLQQGERYVYADAVVVCGPARMEPGTSDVLANPSVVVEVLSRSSEAYDRGDKWEAYQRLSTLTDYLLVSQWSTQIEHFQREAGGSWRYRLVGPGGSVFWPMGPR